MGSLKDVYFRWCFEKARFVVEACRKHAFMLSVCSEKQYKQGISDCDCFWGNTTSKVRFFKKWYTALTDWSNHQSNSVRPYMGLLLCNVSIIIDFKLHKSGMLIIIETWDQVWKTLSLRVFLSRLTGCVNDNWVLDRSIQRKSSGTGHKIQVEALLTTVSKIFIHWSSSVLYSVSAFMLWKNFQVIKMSILLQVRSTSPSSRVDTQMPLASCLDLTQWHRIETGRHLSWHPTTFIAQLYSASFLYWHCDSSLTADDIKLISARSSW